MWDKLQCLQYTFFTFCTWYLRWLPFPFCFSYILSELSLHQGQKHPFSVNTQDFWSRHCRKSSLAATNCVVYKQYSFPKIVQRRHLPITTNSWDFALFSWFTSTAQRSRQLRWPYYISFRLDTVQPMRSGGGAVCCHEREHKYFCFFVSIYWAFFRKVLLRTFCALVRIYLMGVSYLSI